MTLFELVVSVSRLSDTGSRCDIMDAKSDISELVDKGTHSVVGRPRPGNVESSTLTVCGAIAMKVAVAKRGLRRSAARKLYWRWWREAIHRLAN
jgi:hypothetical protein